MPYLDTDVYSRNPKFIIYYLPMINLIAVDKGKDYSVNWVWDSIYGDRPGSENTWALKKRAKDGSEEWSKFQVLVIIPHISKSNYNEDGTLVTWPTGNTAKDITNAVKALLTLRGDVAFIDIQAEYEAEITANYGGNAYLALSASDLTGASLLADDTHPNDRGTAVYKRVLKPFFKLNSL